MKRNSNTVYEITTGIYEATNSVCDSRSRFPSALPATQGRQERWATPCMALLLPCTPSLDPHKCSSWPCNPLLPPLCHGRLLMAKMLLCPRRSRPGTQWALNAWWMDQWARLEEVKIQAREGKTHAEKQPISAVSPPLPLLLFLCFSQQIFFEHLPLATCVKHYRQRMKEAMSLTYWNFKTRADRAALSPLLFSEGMVRLCRLLKEAAGCRGPHSPQS